MKAAYIEGHGGPEALKYGDRPDPVAGADEVVVDIHAASINGADWKVRAGGSIPQSAFPYILGRDFSGVVSAVGEDVDDLQIGDHVFVVHIQDTARQQRLPMAHQPVVLPVIKAQFPHVVGERLAIGEQ